MPILLQVNDLAKEYSGQKIFSGLSFSVQEKEKIGVVGRNGAGKSTLFKIITGEETSDQGEIIYHDSTQLGHLQQTEDWQEAESSLDYLKRLSHKPEWRVRQLASRFELGPDKLTQTAASLSGGWRMRLRLSAMLLQEPNLFLLDEPTNYLDLNTIILLEKYLNVYSGSFLIISHDREFLKRTCPQTIEISKTACYHYPGNIEAYLSFKEQKLKTLMKANESLERQRAHWQEFVERFRYKASKAKQAQALIKKIDKLEGKRIQVEHEAGITRINIPPVPKRNNYSLRSSNLSIGYNQQAVVSEIELDCRAGEKLAILGLNGAGKTTLLQTLAGRLSPISGSFRLATGSLLAYHGPQEISALPATETAGDFLRKLAASEVKTETVLKMAGDFLFKEEDLKKTISVLSGGERSRLLLAALLLSKPDTLLLDEPTCHLDFETTEALAGALRRFNGTVLFASHDQTFSKLVATGILEIKHGQAKRRYEDYEDYVRNLRQALTKETDKTTSAVSGKEENRVKYALNKERQRQLKSLEWELKTMQTAKNELLAYFLEHYEKYDPAKVQELEELTRRISDKEERWLALSEEAEADSAT